jgi:hypothetical protein
VFSIHAIILPFHVLQSTSILANSAIYCSNPANFNDPWDCKAEFNTELLNDADENELHIRWAVDLRRRTNPGVPEDEIARMETKLRSDKTFAAGLISTMSTEVSKAIAQRYRVYCLCPDVGNLLMWAHYADNHRGICLEFSLRNDVMCGAQRCEYLDKFPIIRVYSRSENDNLTILLAKANAWSYEKEYRLIALERSAGQVSPGVMMTDAGFLRLPSDALTAVIVGCQGDYGKVKSVAGLHAPGIKIKRAVRVTNRYELRIEE